MRSTHLVPALFPLAAFVLAACSQSDGYAQAQLSSNQQASDQQSLSPRPSGLESPVAKFRETPTQLMSMRPTGGQGSSNNSSVQEVVILGDPSKPGVYSVLLKVAPNTRIAAHHHDGNRVGTVLEGTWRIGYGSTFDESALKVLPAGSIYSEPNQGPHFARTADEAVVVQITGMGPTDTVYEDPSNDPTR